MTSSVLSIFILVNIASILATPINDVDKILSAGIHKIQHRRSIHDNKVEDGSEIRCSDFFSTTCSKRVIGIENHYDLKKSINEQMELFMKPLNFLLNDYDGKGNKISSSFKIEQQLYRSCMDLGEIAEPSISKSTDDQSDEFNKNQNNEDEDESQHANNEDNNEGNKEYVDQEQDDKNIDASLEEDVKKLTEQIKKTLFDLDKNLETQDNDKYKEILGEVAEDEIESEIEVKTAVEIVRDRFNDIFSVFDKNIYARFNNNLKWQELDQHLELYGFGRTFFNIRVATNPTNPKQNIIVLEPPSIDEWNSKKLSDIMLSIFIDIQKEVYYSCNFKTVEEVEKEPEDSEAAFIESDETEKKEKDNEDNEEEIPEMCRLLKNVPETGLEEMIVLDRNREVINFYNSVLKQMFDPVDVTVTKSSYTLSPLKHLNSILGYTNVNAETTKINWSEIVVEKFKQLNISLADDEIILIRNQPYFENLKDALSDLDDESTVHAIRSKFIAENIRYHDWKKAYSLNPVEKSTFCAKQSKLYVISNLMLYLFQEDYMKPDTFKAERILHNLIDTFHYNISKTEDIPTIQKVQFKSELKAITRHTFRDLNKTFILNFYEDFKLTGNYFIDIINYNSMLKTKNLRTLRLPSLAYESVPFSINEMDNPRNRFILHAILDFAAVRKVISQSPTEKELYYATYGVNMASFLYSLLREEKFGFVDMTDIDDIEWLIPRVSYPPETIKCFITENIIDYGYNLAYSTITDIYGVRFALAALLKDPESNLDSSEKFIKAYAETQCNVRNKRKVKKVLSQIQELPAIFSCKVNDNKICDKPAFRL